SEKKILQMFEQEKSVEGMTKVKFSWKVGTAPSTFDKWCKNGDTISRMEDTNKKHLVSSPKKRLKYDTSKRPSDDRKEQLCAGYKMRQNQLTKRPYTRKP
ncbi:unnamed protein product, partial [Aphanomyces euteiches]